MNNEKLIKKFDKQARIYEIRRKNRSEAEWRQKLIGSAKGRVLEVAVGAGGNFHFYPKDVHLTAVDFSGEMLKKANQAAAEESLQVEFLQSDVESLSFQDRSFDTIVSTLSFCGYEDPYRVIHSFQKWCKPDGQILLMEHGKSANGFVSGLQSAINPLFKRLVGCNLNRDILDILGSSSLRIHRLERYMLGAFYLIWASPFQGIEVDIHT